MPSDLVIPFSGGGSFLQIHAFQDGVLAEFIFNADHSLLYSAVFLKFLGVNEKIVLMVFFRHHMVACQADAVDCPLGIYDLFVEGGHRGNQNEV